jgi:two-component system sensor histidine kinase RegB
MQILPSDSRLAERYAWLRWVAVLGQLTTVMTVYFWLKIQIEIQPILGTIALTGLTNLIYQLFTAMTSRREISRDWPWEMIVTGVMAFDLLLLTALLYYSGGLMNPFCVFFLVNMCLAGVTLSPRSTGILLNVEIACCVFLIFYNVPVPELLHGLGIHEFRQWPTFALMQYGMLIAITTCSLVIAYFTTILSTTLRQRDQELRDAEMLRARGEKLEALGTLAAGAAHELSTPLSTIAIVSKELDREMQKTTLPAIVREDIQLIRNEVDRCSEILNRMSAKAGRQTIESLVTFSAQDLADEIDSGLADHARVRWEYTPDVENFNLHGPLILMSQALRGLIHNALEASAPAGEVFCQYDLLSSNGHASQRRFIKLIISDSGPGMSPEILKRVGEPFFTTKPTGKGMGLGLFLCRSVIERLGGTFQMESVLNEGTKVIVTLPEGAPHQHR